MREKFTFSSLPSFPPDGWENSQPEGTPKVCQTEKKKKRKEKQKKENKQSWNICRIPGDLNFTLHVTLAE